jgi:hypothetical protein
LSASFESSQSTFWLNNRLSPELSNIFYCSIEHAAGRRGDIVTLNYSEASHDARTRREFTLAPGLQAAAPSQ